VWFNYPVEKNVLRFYKFKFEGYEDTPVVIEAYNKKEARLKLHYFIEKHPNYASIKVVNESVTLPIFGRTLKQIDGIENIWVGNLSASGWMPIEEFKRNNYE
jgi:hypothetical protein